MKIAIILEGGMVQDVISDGEAEVYIIDYDVEDQDETKNFLGEEVYVYEGIKNANVDPEKIKAILEEIS